MIDETIEAGADSTSSEGDAGQDTGAEMISVPKKDYETLNQTLGSLKKEIKDYKKSTKESSADTSQTNKTDSSNLLQKSYLRAAGITAADEVDLALATAKKWGVEVDALVDDDDFKVKLEKVRAAKANADATSNIRGGQGGQQTKNSAEYWIAKGVPPSAADIPDRKSRQKINAAFLKANKGGGKTFYND